MSEQATWHFQPDEDEHRTACGRSDNLRSPFAMTTDVRDVDCARCLRSHRYRWRRQAEGFGS